MWIVSKNVTVLEHGKLDTVTSRREFKSRVRAIFYIKYFMYWDADEEFGMMGRPDKEFVVSVTLSYGSVYGKELIDNGDFAKDSDWCKGESWSITGDPNKKDSGNEARLVERGEIESGNVHGLDDANIIKVDTKYPVRPLDKNMKKANKT